MRCNTPCHTPCHTLCHTPRHTPCHTLCHTVTTVKSQRALLPNMATLPTMAMLPNMAMLHASLTMLCHQTPHPRRMQVVLTPLQSALTDCVRDAVNSAAAAQLSALTLWSSLSVASGWLLYRLLRVYPLPIPGSISMTEIRLAQESQAPLQPKGRSKGTSHQPYVSSVTM